MEPKVQGLEAQNDKYSLAVQKNKNRSIHLTLYSVCIMILFLTERMHLPRIKLHITNSTLQDYSSLPKPWCRCWRQGSMLYVERMEKPSLADLPNWCLGWHLPTRLSNFLVDVVAQPPSCSPLPPPTPISLCGWPWTRTVALLPICPALPVLLFLPGFYNVLML